MSILPMGRNVPGVTSPWGGNTPLVGPPGGDEALRAKQLAAMAEALRGYKGARTEGKMVGGRYVGPHWSQQLGDVLQQVMAARQTGQAIGAEHQAQAAQKAADEQGLQDWMAARPQTRVQEEMGPQPEGVSGPVTSTQAPTEQERLAWATKGMQNPLARAIAANYLSDQLIQEPVRAEQREFRSAEAEAARIAQMERAREAAAARMEELKLRMEQQGLDRASREQMAREARALQAQIAQMNAELRRDQINLQRQIAEDKAADKKAADVKTTEGEKSSAGYLTRMNEAEKTLTGLEGKEPNLAQIAVGGVPMIGKTVQPYVLGKDAEKVLQAQRDWVRAKLRKESGAVIGEEEMAEEIRTYFPQPGESEEVRQQKAQARQAAARQMEIGAGAALPQANMAGRGAPVQVKSQADVDKLPPGTTFIGADGRTYVKD